MSQGLDDFNARYVYRVLRPDEDPNEDIACQAPQSRRTVSEHIETGLKTPSSFISTTSSIETALKWLRTSDDITSRKYGNKRTTIVRIDLNKIKQQYPSVANSAIDLTSRYNREVLLQNEKQKSFAAAYREVLFVNRIPSEAVSTEYITGQGFVRNESNTPATFISFPTNPTPNVLHTNTRNTSSAWNNQFSAYYNMENASPPATSLRETRNVVDTTWNSQFSTYSNAENASPPATSLRETRNVVDTTWNSQFSTYSNAENASPPATSLRETRNVVDTTWNSQFSTYYNAENASPPATSLRETRNVDTNWNSQIYNPDYNRITSRAYNPTQKQTIQPSYQSSSLSPYSTNSNSLYHTGSIHSGASSYQWNNNALSKYSNLTDRLAQNTASSSRTSSIRESSYSRPQNPIRDEVATIRTRSLPTRENPTASPSIWRRILTFFSLV